MKALRHLVWSAIASLVLVGLTPTTVYADNDHAKPGARCPSDQRTGGSNSAPNPALEDYFKGDWRLGPQDLPHTGPIGEMLRGYRRVDHTSPYWFLGCYWQTDPVSGKSGWWYPDNHGFALDKDGKPIEKRATLRTGQLVDLFGSGFGNFLAPAGTPYAKRAIPPSNLDEYTTKYPSSYHLYRVVKPFTVDAGPIRPWFGQPGLGLQYMTDLSIPDLIGATDLVALN